MEFNIEEKLKFWEDSLKSNSSFTESDVEELKSHFFDLFDELKEIGLDEEEAFWVASKRIGNVSDIESEYNAVNNSLIQMKKYIAIFAGVLIYFLSYYFLKFSSKLILIAGLQSGVDGNIALQWMVKYLVFAHFLFILFAASIFFLEQRIIAFINRLKVTPKHALFLLIITISFAVFDTCLLPITKNIIRQGFPIAGRFYDVYFYFRFTFPLVICISFVILYLRYFKKAKF